MTRAARCRAGRAHNDGRITVKRSWNYAGSHDHKPFSSTESVTDATLRWSPYVANKGNAYTLTLTPNTDYLRLSSICHRLHDQHRPSWSACHDWRGQSISELMRPEFSGQPING